MDVHDWLRSIDSTDLGALPMYSGTDERRYRCLGPTAVLWHTIQIFILYKYLVYL